MKNFAEQMKSLVAERINADIEIVEVDKNNATLTGLRIRETGNNIAPTIYLEGYKDAYDNGIIMGDIVDKFIEVYESSKSATNIETTFVELLNDWDKAKTYVVPCVRNGVNNPILNDAVFTKIDGTDLVEIYKIKLDDMSVTLNESHIKMYGISRAELKENAWNNVKAPEVCNMEYVLAEMMGFEADEDKMAGGTPMYIATNKDKFEGAMYILSTEYLREIKDKINQYIPCNNMIILPSSIHEVICLPDSFENDMSVLISMVREVNATEVSATDKLSDNVYKFDGEKLTMV